MRKRERDALEAPTKVRVCESCGSKYKLGERKVRKKLCDRCHKESESAQSKRTRLQKRLELKGVEGESPQEMVVAYEQEVEARANELLLAYAETMKVYGAQANTNLMTLNAPELEIAEHDINNEFTPYLKQVFLNLYVKMPRQVLLILETLGVSEKRYRTDLKKYPEFQDAIAQCDRRHTELLEVVAFHNALNPKATSERIFLLKAGDPARYRESYKGNIFNLGEMNITVESNIPTLGIPKGEIAGGKSGK